MPVFEPTWTRRLLSAWAILGTLSLIRLAISAIMLESRRKHATSAPDGLQALMAGCLQTCGTRRRVRIAVARSGHSPLVSGPFRTTILIPEGLEAALGGAEMEQICLHEAAHAARYDDCALLMQRLIEALFVLHPANSLDRETTRSRA
jgi:beta-lactamase regulating signal transducer with metallopeptidase domain